MWVSPFRYPRIIAYLQLPVAFRSLSRLSSALSAKASTLRSFQLNLLTRGAGLLPSSTSVASDAQVLVLSMCLRLRFTLFNFDNNNFRCCTSFWMSLSFNSLRSIMIIHYLFVFGFQGTYVASEQLFTIIRNATHKCFAFISSRASHYTSM